jgi:uncharacterized protein YwqG
VARRFRSALACSAFAAVLIAAFGSSRAQESDVMPLPTTRTELSERLVEAGISPQGAAAIVNVARDALVLDSAVEQDADIAIGASKIGGLPDLPKDMAWPERPAYDRADELKKQYDTDAANLYANAGRQPPWMSEAEGKAFLAERKRVNDEAIAATLALMKEAGADVDEADLSDSGNLPLKVIAEEAKQRRALGEAVAKSFHLPFIAQVDLAALSSEPGFDKALPATGRLLFFYDMPALPASYEPRANAGWRLIYDETATSGLERKALPEELNAFPGLGSMRSAALSPRAVVTTVPIGDASWDAIADISGDDTSLYSDWLFSIGWPTAPEGGNHQLGGWPRAIQSGMQSMSQLASHGVDAGSGQAYGTEEGRRLLPGAKDWRLVLQIGTDEAIGYPFPGVLYVLMREDDLAARRFDKAWVVYEQD